MLDYISPETLVEWVENTAPFLFTDATPVKAVRLLELDFEDILRAVRQGYTWPESPDEYIEDYFALCLSAHHGTVATFIPTDVDSKIRGLLWRDNKNPESHRRMFEFALRAMHWPLERGSRRYTQVAGLGPVSGHNGEQLSVLMGALQAFLKNNDEEFIARAHTAVDEELRREAIEFSTAVNKKGAELDTLRIVASITHNVGDVDQGLSYWPKIDLYDGPRRDFGRLAHENTTPYGGLFSDAAKIYKRVMSPEGHRHYPLRSIKALRKSPDLLLPLGPFFDDWGKLVATHPALDDEARAEVLGALVTGCRKIQGQRGYARAIRGMLDALGQSKLQALLKKLPNSVRKDYEDAELRKAVAVGRESFESSMKKALLAAR
ncbi:hypothetical protein [Bryobacter aggregatus]|uniref:hypothetical protein n=1 Tax=Bryobacter aggregatus TaxID=360054 RepID=UPI0004E2144C|nr:hypothetical protein [Bryobacter aggregatus]